MAIAVTLKNTTEKERGYVAMPRAAQRRSLEASVVQPDGKPMGRLHGRHERENFTVLTPLAAGKSASYEVKLNQYGYLEFNQVGKHTLLLTYTTPDGTAASNEVAFEVIEPAKDAILARHQLQPGGGTPPRPAEERGTAYVDQVKVRDKTYLVYREYVGPKYGGGCNFAKRLATLPGKVDVVVVGAHGSRLPNGWERFFVAYPHKPNGMTTLRIQAVGCEVEERLVFEPDVIDAKDQHWGLFSECKFPDRDNYPPDRLRLTYAAFAAAVKTGEVAKFCLPHAVEIRDAADPKRGDIAPGMNIPWMKKHFSEKVLGCRKDADDCFLLRTSGSYLCWVQTRSGEWRIYKYGDKPIE